MPAPQVIFHTSVLQHFRRLRTRLSRWPHGRIDAVVSLCEELLFPSLPRA